MKISQKISQIINLAVAAWCFVVATILTPISFRQIFSIKVGCFFLGLSAGLLVTLVLYERIVYKSRQEEHDGLEALADEYEEAIRHLNQVSHKLENDLAQSKKMTDEQTQEFDLKLKMSLAGMKSKKKMSN